MTAAEILQLLRNRAAVVRQRLDENKATDALDMEHAYGLDYQADALRDEFDFLIDAIRRMERGEP